MLASIRASFHPQVYTLRSGTFAQPPLFIENVMSNSMSAGDISGFLDDTRVLTSSVFDFQAFLNQAADRFLRGTLASDPVQQVVPQRIPGYSRGEPGVDIARLSPRLLIVQRLKARLLTNRVLNGVEDPLCSSLAQQYLGAGGAGYTFDAQGCMDENQRYAGIAGAANPAPLSPAFTDRLRCIPQASPDPVNEYPWRCAP